MKHISKLDVSKAAAIIHIFETGKPFGDYAACVVLDDGAGISYGISQFTHRSGSLCAVVERYIKLGGIVGSAVMLENLATLRSTTAASITKLAGNAAMKKALKAAAVTREMKQAQHDVMTAMYLKPAMAVCERFGFTTPLALAVVYDSIVHGSFNRVARTVSVPTKNEREWITEYVRRRDAWLQSIPRLNKTRYRTTFFLSQIAISNWELRLPMNVHGFRLTDEHFAELSPTETVSRKLPAATTTQSQTTTVSTPKNTQAPSSIYETATAAFDKVDGVVSGVVTRTDRAKSLWASVGGTLWQMLWAVFGFVAGLPREVWITVAVIAGVLTAMYLYRQICLGRIREGTQL
ncbi:MAG TPA: chitosanase [Pyrinomonadaceae bacterium]|nr:chitosanase [Pyrinomonadaceae bacterium]